MRGLFFRINNQNRLPFGQTRRQVGLVIGWGWVLPVLCLTLFLYLHNSVGSPAECIFIQAPLLSPVPYISSHRLLGGYRSLQV